ncbi:carbamate kinase [Azohydromonas sediminis]|uniref:amino acid kinase family protein n=1 Tax=Azohydromonas sediminis TaxID=2259674 RepID=UPI0013C2EDD7|nr:carbamate kinase [Azohydromonas sediminis]
MAESLLVVALGGNALSPPGGAQTYAVERASIAAAARGLAALAAQRWRLLVVHGNGPQVGRLLRSGADTADLDIAVAQTQRELGYLLADAIGRETGQSAVAVVTRVTVDAADPAFTAPTKPIGPVLVMPPAGVPAVAVGGGWRRVVASPRPLAVVEQDAIATLLARHHVVAGGGGGVALGRAGALAAVIDKDRVAARLAIALGAQALVFATDVAGVEDDHGTPNACVRPRLTVAEARALLAGGTLGAGSMGPKVESAADYAEATGRAARIVHCDAIARALDPEALDPEAPGTAVVP